MAAEAGEVTIAIALLLLPEDGPGDMTIASLERVFDVEAAIVFIIFGAGAASVGRRPYVGTPDPGRTPFAFA